MYYINFIKKYNGSYDMDITLEPIETVPLTVLSFKIKDDHVEIFCEHMNHYTDSWRSIMIGVIQYIKANQ